MAKSYEEVVSNGKSINSIRTGPTAPPEGVEGEVPDTDDMENEEYEPSPEDECRAIVESMDPEKLQLLCNMAQEKLSEMNGANDKEVM